MLDAERLIYDLVSIASPSTEEKAAVEHLVSWMSANGYDHTYMDYAGNAVGIIGNGTREIVLLGHIDTFGGFPPVHMQDRRLYGRGSVDAKGALCTFAAGAVQANLPDDVRVVVIGAVEEEAASSKGARYAATQFQPELCIIGEPSNWDRITLGYKGRLLIEWTWRGGLAHSAGEALSAPEHAIAYWEHVRAYVDQFNHGIESVFGRLDVTLQAINSGQDGAYGWSSMTIGFRLPPGADPQQIAADLANENTRAYGCEKAVVSDKNNPLSRAFRGAIRVQGGTPRFVYKTGTADMNVVAPIWNCPIVAYGPGDSALDHTPDEHLDLDEYLQAIDVLADTLSRL